MDQPIRLLFEGRPDPGGSDRVGNLLQATLNALPVELSVIDESGVAVVVNEPARRFILKHHGCYFGPGVPIRHIIARALNPELAADLLDSLPGIRSGAVPSLLRTYEIVIEGHIRVKQIRLVRFRYLRRSMVILIQEDVSDLSAAYQEVDTLNRRLLATQEDERRRIARELHDSTAQHLVAAGLALTWLPVAHEIATGGMPLPGAAAAALADAADSISEAQKEIRLLSYLLHPPNLERDGLAICLSQFVTGFSRRSGLECRVRIRGELSELDFELQMSFLRVVQEALLNIHRHADATRAEVKLSRSRTVLTLEVSDNGHGLRHELDPLDLGQGVGIPGMSARLCQLGGALDIIDSTTGVTLRASAPIKRSAAPVRAPRGSCAPRSEPGPPSSRRRACASPQPGASPPS